MKEQETKVYSVPHYHIYSHVLELYKGNPDRATDFSKLAPTDGVWKLDMEFVDGKHTGDASSVYEVIHRFLMNFDSAFGEVFMLYSQVRAKVNVVTPLNYHYSRDIRTKRRSITVSITIVIDGLGVNVTRDMRDKYMEIARNNPAPCFLSSLMLYNNTVVYP